MKTKVKQIRFDYLYLYMCGLLELVLAILAAYLVINIDIIKKRVDIGEIFFLILIASFGLYRIYQAFTRSRAVQNLSKTNVLWRSLQDILNIKKKNKDALYLGEGFLWGTEHCQAFHEIANLSNRDKYFRQITSNGGLPYVHNLGLALNHNADKPQVHNLPEHTAIIGTTGIGKTRFFELLIAQLIKNNETVIIIDPKSDKDLFDATYQICLDAGRKNDFRLFSLAHSQFSVKMNPLANFSTPSEIASRITSIMPNTGNSKPFIDFCYDVLATVAEMLILINQPITLQNLYKYSILMRDSLQLDALSFLKQEKLSPERRNLIVQTLEDVKAKVAHDKAHFQKMTTSLLPVLKSLTSGNIGALLNSTEHSLSWTEIIEQKLVVYISLASMKDAFVATNTGKLLVQDLVSYIGQAYTRRTTHPALHLFVDEFYSVAYEGYVDILNKSRAAGLRLYLGLQTTADIEARISDPVRRQMYGLISNKIYMRIPDASQAEELTATLGKCEIPKQTITRTLAAKPDNINDYFRSSYSTRCDFTSTELLPPEILTSLPKGQAILVTQGLPPIKLKIPLLSRKGLPTESYFEQLTNAYQPPSMGIVDTTTY